MLELMVVVYFKSSNTSSIFDFELTENDNLEYFPFILILQNLSLM